MIKSTSLARKKLASSLGAPGQELFSALNEQSRVNKSLAAAKLRLRAVLCASLRPVMPRGAVLDLQAPDLPVWLRKVRVLEGKTHGTRVFRVVTDIDVMVETARPELSRWTCRAIPIDRKTGEPLGPQITGGHPVTLIGNIGHSDIHTRGERPKVSSELLEVLADVGAFYERQRPALAAPIKAIGQSVRAKPPTNPRTKPRAAAMTVV